MGAFDIDAELGEKPHENEAQIAHQLAEIIAKAMGEKGAPARREAHPKAHGCVIADFHVKENLPPYLAQGVFMPGKSYQAYIRFSNGRPDPTRADGRRDARGMAIKLLGVPGEKILASERDAQTQDFLMMSHPKFMVNDPTRYLNFTDRWNKPDRFAKLRALKALGFKGVLNGIEMTSAIIGSPLQARYWSQVPYRLGDSPHKQAIKFSAKPCIHDDMKFYPRKSPNYLRDSMILQLTSTGAKFDFEVQLRAPDMSVEDFMIEWKEAAAPFIKVATITIPCQNFATPERDEFGENLSFTPWHALPQHRPLGITNRIRRVVYETMSKLRHDINGTARLEPVGVLADFSNP